MSAIEIILLSIGLGADAFSVAICVGVCWFGLAQVLRLSLNFGLFQFFMPLLGWYIGGLTTSLIGPFARYVAAGILAVIAIRMLLQVRRCEDEPVDEACDPTTGWSLIGLSIATSIDALGAGFGLGLVASNLFLVCLVIGLTATLMTVIGMVLSSRLSSIFGRRIEALGGIVLIILSIKIAFAG